MSAGVLDGTGQQVLQPVRAREPRALGDGPAVLARQVRHQPQRQVTGMAPRLHPAEPPRDQAHQPVEMRPPTFRVYAATARSSVFHTNPA